MKHITHNAEKIGPVIIRRGFTLIETIMSVTIFAIAIIGPMTLSANSIKASKDSRLHLEALHLAEEGVEIIHNMRDNASAEDRSRVRLGWTSWMISISATCSIACVVDPTSHNGGGVWGNGALDPVGAGSDIVKYNERTGVYSQRSGGGGLIDSPFRRRVTTTVVDARQTRVTSVVSYVSTYGGLMRYATATDDIYNWYPCILASGCP